MDKGLQAAGVTNPGEILLSAVDSKNSNLTYYGQSCSSDVNGAYWQIFRVSASPIEIHWCNGTESFTNVWSARESQTYP